MQAEISLKRLPLHNKRRLRRLGLTPASRSLFLPFYRTRNCSFRFTRAAAPCLLRQRMGILCAFWRSSRHRPRGRHSETAIRIRASSTVQNPLRISGKSQGRQQKNRDRQNCWRPWISLEYSILAYPRAIFEQPVVVNACPSFGDVKYRAGRGPPDRPKTSVRAGPMDGFVDR